ncbi:MAG: glycosyltransferase family 9 protein [Deltaproteobacteria bacterium]|nr:glycosyltransferase family 9 protein [Deltaproteobacteria bacterium]
MKVLIIKLSSIGDVAQTMPALSALRHGLGPRAQIDWLVEEPASGLLKRSPLLNNLVIVQPRGWTRNTKANIKTAKWLQSQRYDAVIDFQGLLKSGAWVAASQAKRKIGFRNAREMSHIFLNEKLPPYDQNQHAIERYLRLAQHVTGKAEPFEGLYQQPDQTHRGRTAGRRRLLRACPAHEMGYQGVGRHEVWRGREKDYQDDRSARGHCRLRA